MKLRNTISTYEDAQEACLYVWRDVGFVEQIEHRCREIAKKVKRELMESGVVAEESANSSDLLKWLLFAARCGAEAGAVSMVYRESNCWPDYRVVKYRSFTGEELHSLSNVFGSTYFVQGCENETA
jgi:hypothetical protein